MNTKPELSIFDELVELHSREIYTYLWRLLRAPEDAEDALQETFLRAFRSFPGLKDHTNLRAWLYKIATNVAYTQIKCRNRDLKRTTELFEVPTTFDHVSRDLLQMVLAAVQNLPTKQGAAVILRNYQGLSYAEIGAALDCSADSARANYYQGLKKLRQKFAEVEE
jgi:RNA polymerase sigma-70 factor, ECF subfamily